MAQRPQKRVRLSVIMSKSTKLSPNEGSPPVIDSEKFEMPLVASSDICRIQSRKRSSDISQTSSSSLRVTRSQTLQKRTVFPFEKLPGELRNIIYSYALDFNGVENHRKLISECVQSSSRKLKRRCSTTAHCPANARLHTPGILLVSHKIFNEAAWMIDRYPVSFEVTGFDHIEHLSELISPALLRRLPTIELIYVNPTEERTTQEYNRITVDRIKRITNYVQDLAEVLRDGHDVRTFRLSFESEFLQNHLNRCAGNADGCYLYAVFWEMMNKLKDVHGLQTVKIEGVVEHFAEQAGLVRTMTQPYVKPEIKFPASIRAAFSSIDDSVREFEAFLDESSFFLDLD